MKLIPRIALLLAAPPLLHAEKDLQVYSPVPGLAASAHYHVRIRTVGGDWQEAFAFETECKSIEKGTDAYFDTLAGWTHAYVNFKMSTAVEVEIARVDGQPIHTAACEIPPR